MRHNMRWSVFCILFVFALLFMGCERSSSFRVVFGNRNGNEIEARANGDAIGYVAPGNDERFVIEERLLDSSPTSADQPDVTEVSFTARDTKTGKITRPFRRTLYTDRVEYIEVQKSDFDY